MTGAYAELVTERTSMGAEHESNPTARPLPNRTPNDPLAPSIERASADDLEVYPHDRFLAALKGDTPMDVYGADALRHIEIRLGRRRPSTAGA